MDDPTFEKWSATLLELRQSRQDALKMQMDERGREYAAKDLFDHLMVSLDQIMSQWWEFERQSWDSNPPADLSLAGETLKSELESVVEFEIEASEKDVESIRSQASLAEPDIDKGRNDLLTFVTDLKKNYSDKIDSLLKETKKSAPPSTQIPANGSTTRVVPRKVSRGSGGNGLGLLTMFMVGLVLGIGLALFFRATGKKSEQKLIEEREKLTAEKREIISEYTALQETYFQLARGKLLTLPELERQMKPIRDDAVSKRRQAEADFAKSRENLLKKIPAGDRLDRSLDRLAKEKEARLQEIESQMSARLEPYLKQQQIHEELMQKE